MLLTIGLGVIAVLMLGEVVAASLMPARRKLLGTLAAGLGLVLAWLATLARLPIAVTLGLLVASGLAHLLDLRARW